MADSSAKTEALKRAFLAIEKAKARIKELERGRNEPIAVISMGCRYPGEVTTPEELWELLERGGDGITEVPRSRFDLEKFYDPDPEAVGKTYTRWGGFLGELDGFGCGRPPRARDALRGRGRTARQHLRHGCLGHGSCGLRR